LFKVRTDLRNDPIVKRDITLTAEIAIELHRRLIREVVRMLNAAVVRGTLSEFNILLGADGPVNMDDSRPRQHQ
jgi:serine/threonine-protein kinase RIO1